MGTRGSTSGSGSPWNGGRGPPTGGRPPTIAAAIRYHHDPEVYILPEKELPAGALALIAVTLIAEHVISDFVDDADIVSERALDNAKIFLGTTDAEIDDFRETIIAALA